MRAWVIGLTALCLSACDAGTSAPAGSSDGDGEPVPFTVEDGIVLNGEGLSVGPEAFYFAAGQTEVNASLARELGKPEDVVELEECGAGPMESATYAGSLTVNFQNGILVGWMLGEGHDRISTRGGFNIGDAREMVEGAEGFELIEVSTLGEEYIIDGGFAGFFEEGEVAMLYAGTQCFFR